jgi:hypothetical protein
VHTTPFWNSYARSQTVGKPNDLKDFGTIKPKDLNMIATDAWRRLNFKKKKITLFRNCKIPEHLSSHLHFSEVRVTRSLVLYVCFLDRCLSFCAFFLLAIVLSVLLLFTNYDCPFGIFKLFLINNASAEALTTERTMPSKTNK